MLEPFKLGCVNITDFSFGSLLLKMNLKQWINNAKGGKTVIFPYMTPPSPLMGVLFLNSVITLVNSDNQFLSIKPL